MPAVPEHEDPADDLQFGTVEPAVTTPTPATRAAAVSTPGQGCAGCGRPITSTYYAARDKLICPQCYAQVNAPPTGSKLARVLKATVFGLGAGLVGAAIWFALRRFAHIQIGLVAILVGYMVGKAVRQGSGGLGGRGYQVLAVVLTYACISANYMPDVLEELVTAVRNESHQTTTAPVAAADSAGTAPGSVVPTTQQAGQAIQPSPANPDAVDSAPAKPHGGPVQKAFALALLFVITFGVSLTAPFLGSPIGLLIIGFALWEAWKFNTPRRLAITGPYQIGTPQPPGSPGVVL